MHGWKEKKSKTQKKNVAYVKKRFKDWDTSKQGGCDAYGVAFSQRWNLLTQLDSVNKNCHNAFYDRRRVNNARVQCKVVCIATGMTFHATMSPQFTKDAISSGLVL